MKTIIYYFTGTGNSLAAAKKIAAALGDCELVPIALLQKTTGEIIPQADRVGIVCPVYFSGLPVMVSEFAERLDLSRSHYIFSIVTFGGSGASSALRQLDGILRKRQNRGLDAGFMVKMPGNYVLMYSPPLRKKTGEAPRHGRRTDHGRCGSCRPVRETGSAFFVLRKPDPFPDVPTVRVPCP